MSIAVIDPTLTMKKLTTASESQFFDRKSARLASKDLAHHLSAFSNASGGLVVIGIENDGTVTGVSDTQENTFRQSAFDFLQTIPELHIGNDSLFFSRRKRWKSFVVSYLSKCK